MATWLCVAHAAGPDYIIQTDAAPFNPIGVMPVPLPATLVVASPTSTPPASASAPAVTGSAASAPAAVNDGKIRIGLLLPTQSKTFGDAAQVVRAGFEAAAATDGIVDVVNVDEQESDVAQRYREAVASGVKVMVGPLTRQGIADVAPYVTVPTLALNALEPGLAPNPKLLSLSLTVEGEARQMATLMQTDGRASPLVVATGDVLSQRLAQAFAAKWKKDTGAAPQTLSWPSNTPLNEALATADSVFVAMTPPDAALLKAALPADMTVYATSQLNSSQPDPALAGIRFIDMPWFLMQQQDEVKRYPRPVTPLTVQTERLYALGIDAYRLAVLMSSGKLTAANLHLHGVTGELSLRRDRQFERILPLAVMMPNAGQ